MIIPIIATVVYYALLLFVVAMWVRLVFDLLAAFVRGFRPRGTWLFVAESAYTVTDPPVKLVRRALPVIRLGGIALDFSWSIVLVVAFTLMGIATALAGL